MKVVEERNCLHLVHLRGTLHKPEAHQMGEHKL